MRRHSSATVDVVLLTPEEGARTQLYLSSSSEVEGVSGGYYVMGKAARSSPRSYDVSAQRRLWEVSEVLVASHASDGSAGNVPSLAPSP